MKKIVLLLVIAMIVVGGLWAQIGIGIPDPASGAVDTVGFYDFFVDQTISTEKRYSAGIFGSYADDFMWFTDYDPSIKTFLLLGGYGVTDGGSVEATDVITPSPYTLNVGFATTFKSGGYLGVYYGGSPLSASGTNDGQTGDKNAISSDGAWNNRFAILFGSAGIGGIRFDMYMPTSTYHDEYGKRTKKYEEHSVTGAPALGLGWGKNLGGMDFYAQLGYRFAKMTYNVDGSKKDTYWGYAPPEDPSDEKDLSQNAKLAIQAGIFKPLATEGASIAADFVIGGIFGSTASGDGALKKAQYTMGGLFLVGASVAYKQIINADDKLSFGFKPYLDIAFTSDDTNSKLSGDKGSAGYTKDKYDARKTNDFELDAGINVGVKYQINKKFGVYTGLGLTLIDWKATGYVPGTGSGDDNKDKYGAKSHAWSVTGIDVNNKTLAEESKLGVGLTFAPTANISIGAGLNTLLDRLFYLDFTTMQFVTGFGEDANTELGWIANNFFGGCSFDLIITAKF